MKAAVHQGTHVPSTVFTVMTEYWYVENVGNLKYFGVTVTNKNSFQEDIGG
jgi:hypothetical protein